MRTQIEFQRPRGAILFDELEVSVRHPIGVQYRLDGLRELMRLELPDRWTDIEDDPVTPVNAGSPGPPFIAFP